jgi:hypothetical protein
MRILFTFIGGSGHLRPLIPVARAAQAAGHTVAIAGAGGRGSEIAAAGFTAFATSEPRRRPEAADRRTVEAPDPEADIRQLAEGFARRGARRHAAAVLELARAWKPDVLVRDEVDFGTAIAAEEIDGEAEVWPGVWIVPTPGHTDGHQSLVVQQSDGTAVLSGQADDIASQFASDRSRRYPTTV